MEIHSQAILSNLGIETLNPMQEAAHKTIVNNDAVLLIAPTGTGKTVGYLMPVLQLMNPSIHSVQCLILVPSRELALQIEQVWKKMSTGLKVNVCYGGHSAQIENKNFSNPPALLIGTPGRIADHIKKDRFSLEEIKTLVLDEFDKSLEFGFQVEMEHIIRSLHNLKKKILVSATTSIEIPEFAGVVKPRIVDFTSGDVDKVSDLTLKLVISEERDKVDTLFNLLCSLNSEPALIFCNHRDACERTEKILKDKGIFCAYYHGGMEQDDRELALTRFRNGSVNYLITTDLAARGLDIPEMKHVIHFHLPGKEHEFLHRNGRTARMHAKGTSYIVLSRQEKQPEYLTGPMIELILQKKNKLPESPKFQTIYISGGKKNKLNKIDIVGSFLQKGKLEKDDLGLIEVKDFFTYVAVKSEKVSALLSDMKDEKLKGKKYKMGVAR